MKGAGDKVCCTFMTYNVLATLFGLLVVAVASWLAADKISFFTELKLVEESVSQEFAQISVVDYGAFILVAIGVAIVIQSILGCTGTMMGCSGNSKARTFLISYGVLVALVVVCEIVAAILVLYVYKGKISAEAKSFMKKTIKEDYRVEGTENSVTLLWNQIMTSLECCGVDDFNDFTGGAPGSCCNSSQTCPASPSPQMTTGCFDLLISGSVPAIASSLAVVTVFQIVGVILACCLARKVEDKREWYEMRSVN